MPRSLSSRPVPPGERALISALQAQARRYEGAPRRPVRLGIGDDCAVLRVPRGHEITVTTDLTLELTHFRRDWHSPESAGHRCLARGLSDIAAMGALPLAAFLSFAVPPELDGRWTERSLDGFLALARACEVSLAGGDTAQAPEAGGTSLFTADIVLLGSLPAGSALLRSSARAGDLIYVSGALGGAAAELQALAAQPSAFREVRADEGDHPHLFPQPRLALARRLRTLASAAIDLSDGLSTDLGHLCESSRLRAEIDSGALPIHPLAQRTAGNQPPGRELALHGGEDYELLFTAPPGTRIPRTVARIPLTQIGRMLPAREGRPRITVVDPDGTRGAVGNRGWEHFRARAAE